MIRALVISLAEYWYAFSLRAVKIIGCQGRRSETCLPPARKPSWPIEDVVPGRFQDTPGGSAYLVEAEYPPEYMHGYTQLGLQLQPNVIAAWAGDPGIASRDASSFAFLDTETSGLAGGTGTYAFMVGAGRYIDRVFSLSSSSCAIHLKNQLCCSPWRISLPPAKHW